MSVAQIQNKMMIICLKGLGCVLLEGAGVKVPRLSPLVPRHFFLRRGRRGAKYLQAVIQAAMGAAVSSTDDAHSAS